MGKFTAVAAAGWLAAWPSITDAGENAPRAAPQSGPLKPGHSAGVRSAQLPRAGLALIGASAIIAVVVVAAGSSSSNANGPQTNFQSVPTTTP